MWTVAIVVALVSVVVVLGVVVPLLLTRTTATGGRAAAPPDDRALRDAVEALQQATARVTAAPRVTAPPRAPSPPVLAATPAPPPAAPAAPAVDVDTLARQLTAAIAPPQALKHKSGQSKLDDALQRACALLTLHEIPYFLCFGTLLGVVREGHPIEGDDDVDLAVDRVHYAAVKAALDSHGLPLTEERTDVFLQAACAEAAVDLYFYETLDEAVAFRWHTQVWDPARPDQILHLPRASIFPTMQHRTVSGVVYTLPRLPVPLLQALYGARWQEPMSKRDYTLQIRDHRPHVVYTAAAADDP